MKRPVPVVPLKALAGRETGLATRIKRMAHRSTLPVTSRSGTTTDDGTQAYEDVSSVLVECPYCDGENSLPADASIHNQHKTAECEIACKHCRCLFLLSESKKNVRYCSIKSPDAS